MAMMIPNMSKSKLNKKLDKAVDEFVDEYIKNAYYPEHLSDIEIELYSIPGRDVL